MSFSDRKAQQGISSTTSDSDTVKIRPSKAISPEGANDNNNNGTYPSQNQIQNLDRIMRDIDRPLPGDVATAGAKRVSKSSSSSKQPSVVELSRQKSKLNFWEDAFSVNEVSPAKERIRGDAIVMAEVKTNVIVSILSVPWSVPSCISPLFWALFSAQYASQVD